MRTSPILSAGLVVLAAAATTTTLRQAQAGGDIKTVKFEERAKMQEAIVAAVRATRGDEAAAIAAKEFSRAEICFIPGQNGEPDRIFRISLSLGVQEERGFRIAQSLHGYGGGWGKIGARGTDREVSCAVTGKLGSKTEGFAAGTFHPSAGISQNVIESKAMQAASTAYHENRHNVFSSKNKAVWSLWVKESGDAILWHMLDEGDAFSRTFLAFAHRYLTTGSEIEKGALEVFLKEQNRGRFSMFELAVEIMGEKQLKDYLLKEGKFPPAFHRFFLALAMDELAQSQSYRSMAAHYQKQFKGKGITLDDVRATVLLEHDGEVFGYLGGIVEYAKTTPLMLTKPGTSPKASELRKTTSSVLHFLENAGANRSCLGRLPLEMGNVMKKIQASPHLKNPFIIATMSDFFQMTIARISQNPAMSIELKEDVIGLVSAVRDALTTGQPINPKLLKTPLRGLAPTQSSACD